MLVGFYHFAENRIETPSNQNLFSKSAKSSLDITRSEVPEMCRRLECKIRLGTSEKNK